MVPCEELKRLFLWQTKFNYDNPAIAEKPNVAPLYKYKLLNNFRTHLFIMEIYVPPLEQLQTGHFSFALFARRISVVWIQSIRSFRSHYQRRPAKIFSNGNEMTDLNVLLEFNFFYYLKYVIWRNCFQFTHFGFVFAYCSKFFFFSLIKKRLDKVTNDVKFIEFVFFCLIIIRIQTVVLLLMLFFCHLCITLCSCKIYNHFVSIFAHHYKNKRVWFCNILNWIW